MIVYNGKKYACVSCVRGHRSSLCDHRDRPLLEVRRRGRPLHESKRAIMLPKDEQDDNGNIITENYIFEPVGNGLYRKHSKESSPPSPEEALPPSPFINGLGEDPGVIAPMDLSHKELIQRLGMTEEEVASIWQEPGDHQSMYQNIIPSCVMPNQCQCDDTCTCTDCFTHSSMVKGMPDFSRPQNPGLVGRGPPL